MSQKITAKKINAKMIAALFIALLILAIIICFYIGKAILGSALGFVLMAVFSILYRVYGYDNSIYVDRHGYSTDYDHSKLPKDF
ncbi:hypothetical protein ACQCN2_16005 [Brevibacillus ginsengisoli]|uniref:hypothetical protein n=1 Tax=Brevibacillus ginsengisoli TaxID=363854 RepID=UPI003CFAC42A